MPTAPGSTSMRSTGICRCCRDRSASAVRRPTTEGRPFVSRRARVVEPRAFGLFHQERRRIGRASSRTVLVLVAGIAFAGAFVGGSSGEPVRSLPVLRGIGPESAEEIELLQALGIPGFERGSISQCTVDFSSDGRLLVGVRRATSPCRTFRPARSNAGADRRSRLRSERGSDRLRRIRSRGHALGRAD